VRRREGSIIPWRTSYLRHVLVLTTSIAAGAVLLVMAVSTQTASATDKLKIEIQVTNLATGQPISSGDRLTGVFPFQVSVRSDRVPCAGQWAVSALGAPGAPPAVLVQVVPFIIDPTVGPATGGIINSSISNDYKITASCNGAEPRQHDFDFFEFFVGADSHRGP